MVTETNTVDALLNVIESILHKSILIEITFI